MIIIYNEQLNTMINNRDNVENNYLHDFFISLLKVESTYLLWPYGIKKQMCERVFAYELYHQWRMTADFYEYDNLLINGEIRKDCSPYRQENFGIVYPDLILHQEQNNRNQQILACEIKTLSSISSSRGKFNVKKDLKKLGHFINHLNYEQCVFIQIKDNEKISENNFAYLKKKKNEFTNKDRIIYVIKENDYIKFDTLQNILR